MSRLRILKFLFGFEEGYHFHHWNMHQPTHMPSHPVSSFWQSQKPHVLCSLLLLSRQVSRLSIQQTQITTSMPPLPLLSSLRSDCTLPEKTGKQVFVLDHKRWTSAMKNTIDSLLNMHHGKKYILKVVDHEYTAMVPSSCKDPDRMLHPTLHSSPITQDSLLSWFSSPVRADSK